MIINIYANGDGSFDVSLPVFDGVEMGLETIEGASRQINEQVWKGWIEQNVYQSILDGYNQLLENLDEKAFNALSPQTMQELARALKEPGQKAQTPIFGDLGYLQSQLQDMADESAARKIALGKMAVSVDHMAGAEAPFHQDGTAIASEDVLDYESITDTLNLYYEAALKEIWAQRTTRLKADPESYVQKPPHRFGKALARIGQAVDGHPGVSRVSGTAVLELLTEQNGANEEQIRVARELFKASDTAQDTAFFFGTPEDLTAYRDATYGSDGMGGPVQLGQYLPGVNVALIANAAPETLLHELVHAHTARVLSAHYANPEASPEHVRFAVARLEELMGDVMELSAQGLEPVDATALLVLQNEIRKNAGRPSAQMAS